MAGWVSHKGHVVALPIENIDTDQLIPARFMSTPRSDGYGEFLLYDLSRDDAGVLLPEFPLVKRRHASILVARRNFGCGSSREAAVYALVDSGFRVVIAPSFGEIFASNAINNGLLPARVSDNEAEILMQLSVEGREIVVDLEKGTIKAGSETFSFLLDSVWKEKLISGWDDIDFTLAEKAAISSFRTARKENAVWNWPQK